MPPNVEDRLKDILEAITEIEDVMRGVSFEQFVSDRRIRLVAEREMDRAHLIFRARVIMY